jgi:hypothetical protein
VLLHPLPQTPNLGLVFQSHEKGSHGLASFVPVWEQCPCNCREGDVVEILECVVLGLWWNSTPSTQQTGFN